MFPKNTFQLQSFYIQYTTTVSEITFQSHSEKKSSLLFSEKQCYNRISPFFFSLPTIKYTHKYLQCTVVHTVTKEDKKHSIRIVNLQIFIYNLADKIMVHILVIFQSSFNRFSLSTSMIQLDGRIEQWNLVHHSPVESFHTCDGHHPKHSSTKYPHQWLAIVFVILPVP